MKTQLPLFSVLLSIIPGLCAQNQTTCDAACQAAFQAALAQDQSTRVSQDVTLDPFWSTPANASGAQPGALLRWDPVPRDTVNVNYTIPSGLSLARMLYMTEDIDRSPIPASAFVLLPYVNINAPSNATGPTPFNTLVWTHGTAGRARECAPANQKGLYYDWQGPFALAQAGYAVIGPDYAGQGSDIPQGFMYEAGYLHAADAAYALIAARKVIGDMLSEEWVVVGHSEGGLTAWRTNERLAMPEQESLLAAGTFLGAVANAPALRPLDLIPESIRRANGGPLGDAVSVFFMQSLALLFPEDFKLEDYLTDTALGRLDLADQGCLQVGRALFADLTADQLFRNTSWLDLPAVVDWQKRYNGAGTHALAAPMLVVQGVDDILVYANNTEADFKKTCAAFEDTSAELLLYPEIDHNTVTLVAQPDYLKWIKERFDHVAVSKGCSTTTLMPATSNFKTFGSFYSGINVPKL